MTGLFISYNFGLKKALKTNEKNKKVIEAETLENNPPPQCFMNFCPEYKVLDVDGDNEYESVVKEPTAMTQQAGRVWIIKDGKVLFKSDERAQIGVVPMTSEYPNNGFIISYATASQMAGEKVFLDSFKHDHYLFKDGQYILEKTE